MRTYGFGIIGCGNISKMHAAAVADMPNARLIAASEPVEERGKAFCEANGCDGYSDYAAMLQRDDIDIVSVCTPSGAHMEPAVAVAESGKHVICEKPVEITLERLDAIINACDANRVRLCAIFPMRFTAAAKAVKGLMDSGRLGRVTLGDAVNKWWRSQDYYDSGTWRGTWALDGGGACMNQGIHAIDLIQWLMGPVESVYAITDCLAHESIEVEDTAVAALRYKSGAMGVIECTTSVHPGFKRRIALHGDKGSVVMEGDAIASWDFAEAQPGDEDALDRLGAGSGEESKTSSDPMAFSHDTHLEQIRDFIAALDEDREPTVDGREGRKAVEIITAIYQSSRTGAPVKLPL